MKRLISSIVVCFLSLNSGLALAVTPSNSVTNCGTNTITFTFDCAFDGTVLINNPPVGITFPGLSGPPYLETVTGGVITFDIEVSGSASTNYNVNFIVLSSNMGCASNNDSAAAAMTSTCILPPNDACVDAEVLTIGSSSCSYGVYSTTNATSSGSVPTCANPGFLDLWYTFNANNSTVVMEFGSLPGSFAYYALYDACPGNGGVQVSCAIMVPGTGATSATFSNLTVGTDYILQLLFLSSEAGNDQEICLQSATVTSSCDANLTISTNGSNPPNTSYQVSNNIITSGTCNVVGNGIAFDAGNSVLLNSGFSTGGNNFEVLVVGCTP